MKEKIPEKSFDEIIKEIIKHSNKPLIIKCSSCGKDIIEPASFYVSYAAHEEIISCNECAKEKFLYINARQKYLINLKPCPFCGGEASAYAEDNGEGFDFNYVKCTICNAGFEYQTEHIATEGDDEITSEEDSMKALVCKWNKRV